MSNYNHCNTCVTDRTLCEKCRDNPIYKNVPTQSLYCDYIPVCLLGYSDCINDPGYIKFTYPDWYKDLYGNMTPEQAVEKGCKKELKTDSAGNKYCECYDDEDK